MATLTIALSKARVQHARVQQARNRRPTRISRLSVAASKKDHGLGGIHDPVGVGQGEPLVKKLDQSQEEQRRLMQQRLATQQSAAKGGAAGLSREAAAERELLEVEAEKQQQARPKSLQSIEADEEYAHMHPAARHFHKAKAALYSWLQTGVEI